MCAGQLTANSGFCSWPLRQECGSFGEAFDESDFSRIEWQREASIGRSKGAVDRNALPTCPTTSDALMSLLQMQARHPTLEVRLETCGLRDWPESTWLATSLLMQCQS